MSDPVPRARVAVLLLAVTWSAVASPRALASPRCAKSCRSETAHCVATQCTTLRGQPRRTCLETCRGVGGCARIRTLAYVVSKCTAHAFHQKLQIRRGNCDPVTVLDFPEPLERPPLCALIGMTRFGVVSSPVVGAFQRGGVSVDGRSVVFEVTDDFSVLRRDDLGGDARAHLVPAGQPKGIFIVRADGRGLRWLGPASRDPYFRFAFDSASPTGTGTRASAEIPLSFSPDGRAVVLTDLGPGPEGEEAVQIFSLDLVTGSRTQLTHLPVVEDRAV